MSVATIETGTLKRWWLRWRFHLSALVVLVPAALTPLYFEQVAMFAGTSGLGAREIGERQVGPWTVRLAEFDLMAPQVQGPAGPVKLFSLALTGRALTEVRAAYLKVGKPRSLRATGAIFFGTPYRQTAGLPVPERTSPDAEVWLTLEGWDGSMQQAPLKLTDVSPVTADWLKRNGGRKP
ncbi:thiamine pyrophosphate-binding protein [Methylopila henanensis]|uniref:Thiamine pyrophosphate-binding protein n=1 Tax=Methylopila henanensis TaxID=873516 RepID=A0ABW4K8G2_9HYPH